MADWYISGFGDDVLGDGSRLSPWKTIAKAHDFAFNGDTIYVLPGEMKFGDIPTSNDGFVIEKSLIIEGILDDQGVMPAIIIDTCPGHVMTVNNNQIELKFKRISFRHYGYWNKNYTSYLIRVYDAKSIQIEQCTFHGAASTIFKQSGIAFNVTLGDVANSFIRNCTFHRLGYGITLNSSDVLIENCTFEHNLNYAVYITGGNRIIFNNCNFHDNSTDIFGLASRYTENDSTHILSKLVSRYTTDQRLLPIHQAIWEKSASTFLMQGNSCAVFGSLTPVTAKDVYVTPRSIYKPTIDADKYKHIYIGLSVNLDTGDPNNNPWFQYYTSSWNLKLLPENAGYLYDQGYTEWSHAARRMGVYECVHIDMTSESDWAGIITDLRVGMLYAGTSSFDGHWHGLFYFILSETDIELKSWERLLSDSQLIDIGKETFFDDHLGNSKFIGQGEQRSDIGAYGGVSSVPYSPEGLNAGNIIIGLGQLEIDGVNVGYFIDGVTVSLERSLLEVDSDNQYSPIKIAKIGEIFYLKVTLLEISLSNLKMAWGELPAIETGTPVGIGTSSLGFGGSLEDVEEHEIWFMGPGPGNKTRHINVYKAISYEVDPVAMKRKEATTIPVIFKCREDRTKAKGRRLGRIIDIENI